MEPIKEEETRLLYNPKYRIFVIIVFSFNVFLAIRFYLKSQQLFWIGPLLGILITFIVFYLIRDKIILRSDHVTLKTFGIIEIISLKSVIKVDTETKQMPLGVSAELLHIVSKMDGKNNEFYVYVNHPLVWADAINQQIRKLRKEK